MVKTFFLALFFLIVPQISNAFEVSPTVADVSFADTSHSIEQIFSVTHREQEVKTYVAEVRLVVFSEDGSIQDLVEVPADIELSVSPLLAEVLPESEQIFTVTFGAPLRVSPDQVFALVLREQGGDDQQLTSGFIALMFPEDLEEQALGSFRIDAFTVGFVERELRAVAQFTNTGDVLLKPQSLVVVEDFFGRELFRGVFAAHEGRLPVGTTRVIFDVLPVVDFGFWHIGGEVTFSLLSVASPESDVQQAVVTLATIPGNGVLGIVGCAVLSCVGGIVFLWRKRGILRS